VSGQSFGKFDSQGIVKNHKIIWQVCHLSLFVGNSSFLVPPLSCLNQSSSFTPYAQGTAVTKILNRIVCCCMLVRVQGLGGQMTFLSQVKMSFESSKLPHQAFQCQIEAREGKFVLLSQSWCQSVCQFGGKKE